MFSSKPDSRTGASKTAPTFPRRAPEKISSSNTYNNVYYNKITWIFIHNSISLYVKHRYYNTSVDNNDNT